MKARLFQALRQHRRLYRGLDRLRWAVGNQSPVRVGAGDHAVTLRCNRFSHVEQMLRQGHFERSRLELFNRWAPRFRRFFDLGANVGLYTLIAARHGVRVMAYEPEPANVVRLRQNVHDNGLTELVQVEPVALGASAGTLELHRALSDNRGMATIHTHELTGYDTIRVPQAALDSYGFDLRRNDDGPTLIKCDVEGGETAVLDGGARFLRAVPDLLWMVEIHRCYGVDPGAFRERFRAAGYPAITWYDDETGRCSEQLPGSTGEPLLLAGKGQCAALLEAEMGRPASGRPT